MRINQGQEFVIAGYTLGGGNFDSIVFGYYDTGKLMYTGRTRSGFTPSSRDQLFKRFKGLAAEKCPFANLPESAKRAVGLRTYRREDERVPVAAAGTRRPVRGP